MASLMTLSIFHSAFACSRYTENPKLASNVHTNRHAAESTNDFVNEDTDQMGIGEPVSDHIIRKFNEHEEKMLSTGMHHEKRHQHGRKLRNANRLDLEEDPGTGSGTVSDESPSVFLSGNQTEVIIILS